MAIATELEVNWNGTVDNTNKIGLSKPFTELPSDVWADDSAFITAYNNPAAKFTKVSDGYPTCPVKSNDCPWYLTGGIGYSNINHNSDSIYLRSAIICIPDDFVYNTWNGNQGGRIRNNINNFRIVTSMSTQKNGVDVSLTVQDGTVVGAQYVLKETLAGSSSNGGITIGAGTYILMIVDIYTVEGNYYLNIPYSLPGFVYDTNNGDGVMGMWAYDSSVNEMFSLSPQIFPTDDGRISITGGATYNVNTWNRHELPAVEGDANLLFCASYIPWNWYLSLSGNVHYHLLAVSRFGLRFKYNNDNYKPIITGGVVTGYTTDMTVPSDIDNWTDISGHNISPTPPVPPTPVPSDDPWTNIGAGLFSGTGGAFLSIVTMTAAECEALALKLNSIDVPTGFDPMPAIMGLKYFPFPISGGTVSTVQFGIRKGVSADYPTGGSWNTGVGCKVLTTTTMVMDLGYVDVPNRMNERGIPFLDYDAVYEAYIPFCGVFPLDTNFVTGRRLHAYLYVDVISGNCTGIIYALDSVSPLANGIPVAMGNGSCSVEVPVSSNQYGLAKESLLASGVKSIFAIGTGAAQAFSAYTTGNAGNAIGATSSFWEAGTRMLRAYTSLNNNLTTCTGISGDQSAFFLPPKAYIKIVRPKYIKDTMYNSSCGIPVGDSGTLPTGYSMAINPEVNSITEATDEERSLIYNYLVTGVYKK